MTRPLKFYSKNAWVFKIADNFFVKEENEVVFYKIISSNIILGSIFREVICDYFISYKPRFHIKALQPVVLMLK